MCWHVTPFHILLWELIFHLILCIQLTENTGAGILFAKKKNAYDTIMMSNFFT